MAVLNTIKMEVMAGEEITRTIASAITRAKADRCRVEFGFNGVLVTVEPDSRPDLIHRDWSRAMSGYIEKQVGPHPSETLTEEEKASDACIEADREVKRQQRAEESRKAQSEQEAKINAELATAGELELVDADGWKRTVANNQDGYGACTMRYAERWGRLMQARIRKGQSVAECAEETSFLADTEGVTGFMQGCAKSILRKVWKHGQQLI